MTLWDHSLFELLEKGGMIMWPLLACSVVAFALVVDRTLAFVRARIPFDRVVEDLRESLAAGKLSDALELCRAYPRSPVAQAAEAYLGNLRAAPETRQTIVEREGERSLEGVESRLRGLSTIAQIATLLGLLGTVAGLVSAFHQIELNAGQVEPRDLAEGIWEALMTTVFGLSVAIPSFLAFHAFDSRVESITKRMEYVVSYLDEWTSKSRARRAAPSEASRSVARGSAAR